MMPLQNRVSPFGDIEAAEMRGLFTGNRGVIHNPDTKTLLRRRWSARAWIICDLVHPKGITREVFGRNAPRGGAGWTELFFLDEVTALAAGHRPCFYCRRQQAKAFALCFADAFGIAEPKVADMDGRLHVERMASGGQPAPISADELAALPDGAMIAVGGQAHAIRDGRLLPSSFSGYGRPIDRTALAIAGIRLITPPTTIAVLRKGYQPAWHTSAA